MFGVATASTILFFTFAQVSQVSQVFGTSYTSNVNCVDSNECNGDTIDTTLNIYCKGYEACEDATLEADLNVFCTGDFGCMNATIVGEKDVRCQSEFSCYKSDINNVGYRMQVYGYDGARSANINGNGSAVMYAHGFVSARYAQIYNITYVLGRGAWGLYYADIYSTDLDELDVILQGYYTGSNLDIYCYDGSTCSVTCGDAPGCSNTNINCYDDATCEYSCDSDCGNCPTVYDESSDITLKSILKNPKFNSFDDWVKQYQTEKHNKHIPLLNKKYDQLMKKYERKAGKIGSSKITYSDHELWDDEYMLFEQNYIDNEVNQKWFKNIEASNNDNKDTDNKYLVGSTTTATTANNGLFGSEYSGVWLIFGGIVVGLLIQQLYKYCKNGGSNNKRKNGGYVGISSHEYGTVTNL